MLIFAVQTVIAASIGLLLLAFRWVWRQSPTIGVILGAAILVRAAVGTVLFWVYRSRPGSSVPRTAGPSSPGCCGAVGVLLPLVHRAGAARMRSFWWGLLALAAAAYAIGGIRPYYAVIVCGSLAVVLILFIVRQPAKRLVAYACTSCLVLGVVWTAYGFGAGSDYIGPENASPSGLVSELQIWLQVSRRGFLTRPGGTNMVAPDAPEGLYGAG